MQTQEHCFEKQWHTKIVEQIRDGVTEGAGQKMPVSQGRWWPLMVAALVGIAGCQAESASSNNSVDKTEPGRAVLTVTCPEIPSGGECPREYTGMGAGSSPEVSWTGAPAETKSFAVSLWRHYADTNADTAWTSSYWLIYNIPADVRSLPKDAHEIGVEGYNDSGKKGYYPLRSKKVGVGDYHITVYALSEQLTFDSDKKIRRDILNAAKGIILAEGTLDFHYDNSKTKLTQK